MFLLGHSWDIHLPYPSLKIVDARPSMAIAALLISSGTQVLGQ
jgi:hypothetical protein